ncbi:MAG: DUF3291 domain-containing protein [Candidatus Melainabacteria bacterium]
MREWQLCHLNIGPALGPLNHPVMSGFVERLDEMNQLAYESPGFIWHLIIDINDPVQLAMYGEPGMLFNLSVWESVEALHNYVYNSMHVKMLQRRKEWFAPMSTSSYVLWWKPKGELPTLSEAKEKLKHLDLIGPTIDAFTFKKQFMPAQANPTCVTVACQQ